MNAPPENDAQASLAKSLAPEDVRVGDFVTVLDRIAEYPSFLWCCDSGWMDEPEVRRLRYRARDSGAPLLVKQVCLPFVFVVPAKGKPRTLDLRSCSVARLDAGYANAVWNALTRDKKGKKAPDVPRPEFMI